MTESYPFQQTKISLNDLILKAINENPLHKVQSTLSSYTDDYYAGYKVGDDEKPFESIRDLNKQICEILEDCHNQDIR